MYNNVFYIILAIIIADYILERVLDYLNYTKRSSKLPKELEGIYDARQYEKQQNYEKETSRFSFITSSLNFAIILLMLLLGGFAFIDDLTLSITSHPIVRALIFFGIIMLVSDIISTPFSVYSIFVIEEKYGFNKTTPKTFILDKLKGWMLSAVIGGGLLSLIIWFYMLTTDNFWIYAWIMVSGFSIFMAMFYSTLIVPLFNKQTPLEGGELRDAIEQFSAKTGFKLDNIFVIDGSKRSTKANAYFSGLGAKKRIVLFDTLINDFKIRELIAVLAHEIGHYKKKHTMISIVLSIVQTGVMFYIFSLFIDNIELTRALGSQSDTPVFHLALITFGILYSPISMILGLALNTMSRKNEYEADAFAAIKYSAAELANALKKLSVKNLSNLTPHPAYVFFYYSHPPLLQRLHALSKYSDNKKDNNNPKQPT